MTGKATGLGIAAPRPMICRKFEDTLCVPARRAMVFRALGMMCSDDVLESSVSERQHQQQGVHAQLLALPEFIQVVLDQPQFTVERDLPQAPHWPQAPHRCGRERFTNCTA